MRNMEDVPKILRNYIEHTGRYIEMLFIGIVFCVMV